MTVSGDHFCGDLVVVCSGISPLTLAGETLASNGIYNGGNGP